MAEDIQGLLNKIQEEGIGKAEAERKAILDKAHSEAQAILDKAKTEATEIREKAEADSNNITARAESAVQQAARDIILKLEDELRKRLNTIVRESATEAMTPALMAEIVKEMLASYTKEGYTASALEVMVTPKTIAAMEEALRASLRSSFAVEPRLFPDMELGGGIKVSISGDDVFSDFSDEAITEIVASYIGPRLAAIITGKKE